MSLVIPVSIQSGLRGNPQMTMPLTVTAPEVGFAATLFGSQYILRMGLHFDRYVVTGYQPWWNSIQDIYSAVNPAAAATRKSRSASVTGNIGECIAALVARRNFGSRVADVEPINPGNLRSPDFRVVFRPAVPNVFQLAVGTPFPINFTHWPVESKAAATQGGADRSVRSALLQLGAYWYTRAIWEPDVVGFGVAICFVYRGTQHEPGRGIRVHVFTPNDAPQLREAIDEFRANDDDLDGFLTALRSPNSAPRNCLRDV